METNKHPKFNPGQRRATGVGLKGHVKGRDYCLLKCVSQPRDKRWLGVMGPLSLSLAVACDRTVSFIK